MIYLHKILPVFVMPIMLIIYLLIFALWKRKRWPVFTAIVCFYIFSTPVFVNPFFRWIEGSEPRPLLKDINNADAIVVLSGMITQVKSTDGVYPEWGDPDRFLGGVELYKAGKAPKLIFTGGKMPWDTTNLTEGEILKKFALAMGVNDSDILITKNVLNTADEAGAVIDLLGSNKKILIVTSAYHMQRSQHLFETKGFKVIPYKVDWKVDKLKPLTILDFLPDSESFRLFNLANKEILGLAFYFNFRSF